MLCRVGNFPQILHSVDVLEKRVKKAKAKKKSMVPPSSRGIFQASMKLDVKLGCLVSDLKVWQKVCARGRILPLPLLVTAQTWISFSWTCTEEESSVPWSCGSMMRPVVDAFLSQFWKQSLFLWHSMGLLADLQRKQAQPFIPQLNWGAYTRSEPAPVYQSEGVIYYWKHLIRRC